MFLYLSLSIYNPHGGYILSLINVSRIIQDLNNGVNLAIGVRVL